ncbi:hypothetical protein FSP39_017622 [Pinctada imbricata]|uniref:Sodium-dependent glucose transporter 1 n=1 Tax=Pinctada imbricata TaxID=66713 RepID=A0AA88YMX3_PINIB|nr:hypothetical protein FSP39_017622 [Pinctada imbricata]
MDTIILKSMYPRPGESDDDGDGEESSSDSELQSFIHTSYENAVMDKIRRLYERVPFKSDKEERGGMTEEERSGVRGVVKRLRGDEEYRGKVVLSLSLLWSFVILGWIIGQFGPSFLDLQIITGTTLEKGSAFMTAHSVGYLTGSMLSGILFDRYHKMFLIFLAVFGNALTVGIIPWCAVYELMVIIHIVKGTFSGALDAIGNAEIVYTWGDKGRSFMQALHFCFALGGILSPLATAPFLAPKQVQIFPINPKEFYPASSKLDEEIYGQNSTLKLISNVTDLVSPHQANKIVIQSEHNSRLYIAYLISSFLGLTASVPFFVMFIKSKSLTEGLKSNSPTKEGTLSRKYTLGRKIIVMTIMMCIMGTYSAIEDTFAGFLATFCVKQMDWSKASGSFATSIYWAAFGGGRFCGIFLVQFFSPVRMILIYLCLLITAFGGLFVTSLKVYDAGVWLCAPLSGFALSIIFPTIFIWTEEEMINVTGKIASLFLIASSSGTMINPIVLGLLMDKLTPMWFCYLLLAESVTLLFLYLMALAISIWLKSPKIANIVYDSDLDIRPEFYDDYDHKSLLYGSSCTLQLSPHKNVNEQGEGHEDRQTYCKTSLGLNTS